MAGSAISAVGSAFAGKAASSLLGGGKTKGGSTAPPPMLFNAGGLRSEINNLGQLRIKPSKQRLNLLRDLKSSYRDQAGRISSDIAPRFEAAFNERLSSIDELLPQVAPGIGRLTDARVDANNNARKRTLSNLSDSLARRRITGSSFGQNSLVQAENEFAQQEAEIRAQSFLEELELTNQFEQEKLQIGTAAAEQAYQLLLDAFTLDRAATEVDLNEMNRQQEIATSLLAGVQAQLNRNADLAVNDIKASNALAGNLVGGINTIFGKQGGIDFSGVGDFIGGLF